MRLHTRKHQQRQPRVVSFWLERLCWHPLLVPSSCIISPKNVSATKEASPSSKLILSSFSENGVFLGACRRRVLLMEMRRRVQIQVQLQKGKRKWRKLQGKKPTRLRLCREPTPLLPWWCSLGLNYSHTGIFTPLPEQGLLGYIK